MTLFGDEGDLEAAVGHALPPTASTRSSCAAEHSTAIDRKRRAAQARAL
jgi:hypothetical protein